VAGFFLLPLMAESGLSSAKVTNARIDPITSSMSHSIDSLRIDRWLYYSRFFKTRSRATAAVSGGHVKINDDRATPGCRIKRGDRIDLVRERILYSLEVLEIPTRRGPAAEAKASYREDEETVRKRDLQTAALKQDRLLTARTDGRPDKHTRRKLRERNRDL